MDVLASLSLAATLACGAAVTGCGGDDNNTTPAEDSGVDVETPPVDAGKDSTTTTTPDAGVDAKADTGTPTPDAGNGTPDTGPDSPALSACATPTFSPVAGTVAQGTTVTLAATNLPAANGFIYYTVDGTIPTHSSPVFSAPITINGSETIHAIAFAQGVCTDSTVATGVYTVSIPDAGPPDVVTLPQCGLPTIAPNGGSVPSGSTVTVTPAAGSPAGEFIFYTTDGTLPTHSSPLYSGPIQVSADETLHAIAFTSGVCTDSALATASFTVTVTPVDAGGPPTIPTFNPTSLVQNNDFLVALSSDPGATICYRTDGNTPTCANGTCDVTSQTYVGTGVAINGTITNANGQVTVNAIACKAGVASSAVGSQQYTLKASTPTAVSPAPGTLPFQVAAYTPTLASATSGSSLNTATGATLPTCVVGTPAANPSTFSVTTNTTVNAIACKAGYAPSDVATLAYAVKLNNPILETNSVPFAAAVSPTITDTANTGSSDWYCTTTGATGPTCGTSNVGGATSCPTTGSTFLANGSATAPSVTATGTTVNIIACGASLTSSNVVSSTYTLQLDPPDLTPPGVDGTTGLPVTTFTIPAGGLPAITIGDDAAALGDQAYGFLCVIKNGTPACGINACTTGTLVASAGVTPAGGTIALPDAFTPVAGDSVSLIACPTPAITFIASTVTTVAFSAPGAATAPAITPVSAGPYNTLISPLISNTDTNSLNICYTTDGTTPTCVNNACGGGTTTTFAATGAHAATVTSITVTSGGAGYVGVPLVSLSGGGGTGATATAVLGGSVTGVTITAGGTGYVSSFPVLFIGGGATAPAVGTATAAGGVITSVTVISGGSGYTSAPTVSLAAGAGVGGAATAAISTGSIAGVTVTAAGTGYSTPPTVTFTGGGPTTAATATAVLNNSVLLAPSGTDNEKVLAVACNATETTSTLSTQTYNFTLAEPDFSFVQTTIVNGDLNGGGSIGAGQQIRLSTASNFPGETIHYTTSGVAATCSTGTSVANDSVITVAGPSPLALSAIACNTVDQPSVARAASFTVTTATPVLTAVGAGIAVGTVHGNLSWENTFTTTISSATEGAEICYTTDGTTPACTAGVCGGSGTTIPAANGVSVPITVSGTQLRAVACTATLASTGAVAAANYTLTISNVVATGTMACPSSVTIALDDTLATQNLGGPTDNVMICYTTDGTTPNADCTVGITSATCFSTGVAGLGTSGGFPETSSTSLNIVACKTGFIQPASIATSAAVTPYSHTITVDGAISEWVAGETLTSTTAATGYFSRDATNLYFAATGYSTTPVPAGTDVVIYLGDTTGGSTAPPPVFGTTPIPFSAKWAFGWAANDSAPNTVQAFTFTGGAWTTTTLPGLTVGFQSGATVEFGLPIADIGSPATVVYAGAAVTGVGTAPVTVTQWPGLASVADVLASCETPLEQVTPVITSLAPPEQLGAAPYAAVPITINGIGFTGATVVHIGGTTPAFTVVSDTVITSIVPGSAIATSFPITVTTPFGTSNTATFADAP